MTLTQRLNKLWNNIRGRKIYIGHGIYTYGDGKHDDSKYIQKVVNISGGVNLPGDQSYIIRNVIFIGRR